MPYLTLRFPAARSGVLLACVVAAASGCDSKDLAGPVPAVNAIAALQPESERVQEPFSFPIDCQPLGFPYVLQDDGTADTHVQTFFDQSGSPVRQLINIHVASAVTNLSSGNTYRDDESIILDVDLTTGLVSINGGVAHVISPGEGIVIQDTGRIVFDANFNLVFVAGPHDQNDLGPAQAYCAALQ